MVDAIFVLTIAVLCSIMHGIDVHRQVRNGNVSLVKLYTYIMMINVTIINIIKLVQKLR